MEKGGGPGPLWMESGPFPGPGDSWACQESPNSLRCLGVHSGNLPTLAGTAGEEANGCGIPFPVSLSGLGKGAVPG